MPLFLRRLPPDRSLRHSALDVYSVRIMLGLVASLSLLVLCFRLPVRELPGRIGWGPKSSGPPISLKEVREAERRTAKSAAVPGGAAGAPITSFDAIASSATDGARSVPGGGTPPDEELASPPADEPEVQRRMPAAELHTVDRVPHAIGGIGGVYLKIGYPEAARRDSIEGRLLVQFVVEKDGSTSEVRVAQALHPLCDSAAVHAVERSRFVPGERDGKAVRVTMRLPVRFELVDQRTPLQAQRTAPSDGES